MPNFRLALIQMSVTANKSHNLENAAKLVKKASQNGANVVVLPECFNSPYGTQYFAQYAEPLNGETGRKLSAMAQQNSIYLIGGSFP